MMFDVDGFILVGGASRRMGVDKAQLLLGQTTVLKRVATEVTGATSSLTLVGARQEYPDVSLRNIDDTHKEWGALGGIHAALLAATTDWALIVACDLPFVTGQLIQRLKTFVEKSADAVVPIQPDARPQPLCALYHRETCLAVTEKLIRSGEHMPRTLLTNVRTRFVQFSELSDLPRAENFFLNLNAPADFERARTLV